MSVKTMSSFHEAFHQNLCNYVIKTIIAFGNESIKSLKKQQIQQFFEIYNKKLFIKRTIKANKLKEIINQKFNNKSWKVSVEEKYLYYLNYICTFLQDNGENAINPCIKLSHLYLKNIIYVSQSEILYKYKINENEYGIKTTTFIPHKTVIGQYLGVEYLYDEFYNSIHDVSKQNGYAFILNIDYKHKNHSKIVIDGDDDKVIKPLTIFIEDCGSNQNNIIFIPTWVNGWPTVFIVTTRNIQQHEQLLGYYTKKTIL